MIGQIISHYKIVEKVGSGGMGDVYKAIDLKLDRFVALKFLPETLYSDEESRKRFELEARALSVLDHPNIAVVYEFGEVNERMFISMGYYQGETLKERIARGPLSIQETCDIALQIFEGLKQAHDREIIHRDIKPENILLAENNQAKILDFGLVKQRDAAQLTEPGTILGTMDYMSPEQICGETVDRRTDIFSLGVVLYEMLTGERPFQGEYSASLLYAITNEEPIPIRELRPELPEALQTLVLKALAKDKKDRYQSVDELETDLRAFLGETQRGPGAKTGGFQTPKIRPRLKLLAAALLIVLAFLAGWKLWTLKPRQERPVAIAIMPFTFEPEEGDWRWLRDALAELLSKDLSQYSDLKTLSGDQQRAYMKRLGIQDENLTTEQMIQIANKAKSEFLISGELAKDGNELTVRARVLNGRTGTTLHELAPLASDISRLYELVDDLSAELARVLEIPTSSMKENHRVASLTTSSLDAYRYYVEGKNAAYDLRHRVSIEKLRLAIQLDSSFVQPYYWLAWQYSLLGDNQRAKDVLAQGKPYVAKLSETKRLEYLANEASLDTRWNDYSHYLERLLRLKPNDANVQFRYGWVQYRKFRQLDAGIAAMEKSLRLDSTYTQAYNTLGHAYLARGDKLKAMEMIQRFITLNPTDLNPLDSMAEILVLTGEYDRAVAHCERILARQADFEYAYINLARALLAEGKYRRATETIENLMQTNSSPRSKSTGQALLAYGYFVRRDLEKSFEAIEAAVGLDSTNLEAHWMRGRIALRRNDPRGATDAIRAIERILSRQGGLDGRWYLYHLQALNTLDSKDYQRAQELLRRAVELGPLDRAFYLTELANTYVASGRLQESLKYYTEALQFNPNNAFTLVSMAQACEQLGKSRRARAAYRKAAAVWASADEIIEEHAIAKSKI